MVRDDKLNHAFIWCNINDERIALCICEHRCKKKDIIKCKKYLALIKELNLQPIFELEEFKKPKKNKK